MRFVIAPLRIYFARLPDDERELTKIVAGTFYADTNVMVVRGLWDPDSWDALRGHPYFNDPVPLLVDATGDTDMGIVLRVCVPVPLELLPEHVRAEIGAQAAPEEAWRGTIAPEPDTLTAVELGRLIRTPERYQFNGALLLEVRSMLANAFTGRAR